MQQYLFCGDEEYLKDKKLKDLKDTYLPSAQADIEKAFQPLNYSVFCVCPALDINEVIQTARTSPFLNPNRIVVLKDLHYLQNPSHQKILLDYLKNPTPTTILVLFAGKFELTGGFISQVHRYVRVFRFNKLGFAQLSNWIQKSFSARKKEINKIAIDTLIEIIGNDLATLESCIEKISLYAGSKSTIERQDVEATVGRAMSGSVFNLVDTIIQKDSQRAVILARDLIKSGKKVPTIINVIFKQFEKLFLAKTLLNKKFSKETTGARLGINRSFVEKFFNQVNSFTEKQLIDKFRLILWADLKAKTTGLNSDIILEILVTQLCLGKEVVDLY